MTDDELFGVVLEWMTEHPDAVDQVRETLADMDGATPPAPEEDGGDDVVEYLWAAGLLPQDEPAESDWDSRWP